MNINQLQALRQFVKLYDRSEDLMSTPPENKDRFRAILMNIRHSYLVASAQQQCCLFTSEDHQTVEKLQRVSVKKFLKPGEDSGLSLMAKGTRK